MPPQRPKLIDRLTHLPKLGNPVRKMHDAWLRRRLTNYWQAQNTPARQRFESAPPALSHAQQRVLKDLSESGIAFARFDELIADHAVWEALFAHVQQWLATDEIRQKEEDYLAGGFREARWKEYILMMHGTEGPIVRGDSPLLALGLRAELLDLANSYLGQWSRLFHVDAWKTIPLAREGAPTGSQRWHRDPEDLKLVKVFLYLSDVDGSAGPLHYVKYSRRGDRHGHLWPQQLPYGSVAPPNQLETQVPRADWEICARPAGTFVFVDTTGLHMGGRATANHRLFAMWAYSSLGSVFPRSFTLAPPAATLSATARFALFE